LQLDRIAADAERAGLRIDRRLDVVPREGKAPLFSVYAMRPGPPQTAPRLDTLVVRSASGERTARFGALREEMGMPR
jgi:hypothetical protein